MVHFKLKKTYIYNFFLILHIPYKCGTIFWRSSSSCMGCPCFCLTQYMKHLSMWPRTLTFFRTLWMLLISISLLVNPFRVWLLSHFFLMLGSTVALTRAIVVESLSITKVLTFKITVFIGICFNINVRFNYPFQISYWMKHNNKRKLWNLMKGLISNSITFDSVFSRHAFYKVICKPFFLSSLNTHEFLLQCIDLKIRILYMILFCMCFVNIIWCHIAVFLPAFLHPLNLEAFHRP